MALAGGTNSVSEAQVGRRLPLHGIAASWAKTVC